MFALLPPPPLAKPLCSLRCAAAAKPSGFDCSSAAARAAAAAVVRPVASMTVAMLDLLVDGFVFFTFSLFFCLPALLLPLPESLYLPLALPSWKAFVQRSSEADVDDDVDDSLTSSVA
jgi:hypothetical protein